MSDLVAFQSAYTRLTQLTKAPLVQRPPSPFRRRTPVRAPLHESSSGNTSSSALPVLPTTSVLQPASTPIRPTLANSSSPVRRYRPCTSPIHRHRPRTSVEGLLTCRSAACHIVDVEQPRPATQPPASRSCDGRSVGGTQDTTSRREMASWRNERRNPDTSLLGERRTECVGTAAAALPRPTRTTTNAHLQAILLGDHLRSRQRCATSPPRFRRAGIAAPSSDAFGRSMMPPDGARASRRATLECISRGGFSRLSLLQATRPATAPSPVFGSSPFAWRAGCPKPKRAPLVPPPQAQWYLAGQSWAQVWSDGIDQ